MCYNYSNDFEPKGVIFKEQSFSLEDQPDLFTSLDDGFLYDSSPVLRMVPGKDELELVPMQWGFLPNYIKTWEAAERFRKGYKGQDDVYVKPVTVLNARGEELVLPGKIFRKAANESRCLVPANGFYEWQDVIVMGKRGKPLKNPVKYPYFIFLRDQPMFYFLGVYNTWVDTSTGETILTFAIVTTRANKLMTIIHNNGKRMPVISTEDLATDWLLREQPEERIADMAKFQYPYHEMGYHTVAKDFKQSAAPKMHVHYDEVPKIVLE